MTEYSFDLLANYQLTVKGYTYHGIASIREDFFDGWFGSQYYDDILTDIIDDERLPIRTSDIINWEITPAN